MPARVTRDDVARRAGVSVATVSYVLNAGPRGVSDEKRRRVLQAVAELGYRPNAIARSLRARRTHILGLVLPNTANPYFAALSHAIEEVAAERGYQVVVSNAAESPERETRQIEALLQLQVDGLLWIPADLSQTSHPSVPPEVPAVQVDRALPQGPGAARFDAVGADNRAGGTLAAEHVVALGHRRVAVVSGPADHRHAQDRLSGTRVAMAAAGLDLPPRWIAYGAFDYASGAIATTRWLKSEASLRPTAILCANDVMAIGALHAASELGVHVPDDLSVVGFDDIPAAAYAVPALTTVAQPVAEMGVAAVTRLLARIEMPGDPALPAHQVLPVRLVVRRSTGPSSRA
jgi:LacI family transcriptional regulator